MKMISVKQIFVQYGIFIFLMLLFAFASMASPSFLNPQNLRNILNQAAALGIVSIGQTFVILTGRGGLDISVAAVISTVAVIFAKNTGGQDSLFLPVALICLLFGALVGLANGLLITKRRVPPFIATLGMMIIIQGLRFIYTKGAAKGDFPPLMRFLGAGNIGPIPVSILSFTLLALIATIVLNKTIFGRQVYAVGGNIHTAYLSGYNTDLIITMTYIISGFMAAIAGLYLGGWIGIVDNWVGKGYHIDSIAAVVIGGTSLAGGRGGIFGTVAGVLILVMLYNIVLLLHLPVQTQYIVKGVVIIIAVLFYTQKRAR